MQVTAGYYLVHYVDDKSDMGISGLRKHLETKCLPNVKIISIEEDRYRKRSGLFRRYGVFNKLRIRESEYTGSLNLRAYFNSQLQLSEAVKILNPLIDDIEKFFAAQEIKSGLVAVKTNYRQPFEFWDRYGPAQEGSSGFNAYTYCLTIKPSESVDLNAVIGNLKSNNLTHLLPTWLGEKRQFHLDYPDYWKVGYTDDKPFILVERKFDRFSEDDASRFPSDLSTALGSMKSKFDISNEATTYLYEDGFLLMNSWSSRRF